MREGWQANSRVMTWNAQIMHISQYLSNSETFYISMDILLKGHFLLCVSLFKTEICQNSCMKEMMIVMSSPQFVHAHRKHTLSNGPGVGERTPEPTAESFAKT